MRHVLTLFGGHLVGACLVGAPVDEVEWVFPYLVLLNLWLDGFFLAHRRFLVGGPCVIVTPFSLVVELFWV